MKKNILVVWFTLTCLNLSYSQCGLTGMQSQILQNSSFAIQNTSSTTLSVKVIDGNYPTTLGVEDNNGVPGNIKALSAGEIGAMVTDVSSQLGIYDVRINNPALGCVDTIEVAVVMTLPVEWLNPLTAISIDSRNEIYFATAQQINNSHFEIERSINGFDFEVIKRIEGEGNSTKENYYSFLDKKPLIGTNYYRVKQVDFDGNYEYSNVASITFESNETQIYPNPSSNLINIQSANHQEIVIFNQLGAIMKKTIVEKGENRIDISELPSGTYYLNIGEKTELLVKE